MGNGPPPEHVRFAVEQAFPGFSFRDFELRCQLAVEHSGVPAIVTSWYRNAGENARAGGNPRSQHLLGLAFDLAPDVPQLAAALQVQGFIVVREGDHIHAQQLFAGNQVAARLMLEMGLA